MTKRNDGSPLAALRLVSFRPLQGVQRKTRDRAAFLQPIEQGIGRMNIDNYRVQISKLPRWNDKEIPIGDFFQYFRKNINLFLDRNTCVFKPWQPADQAVWSTKNPVGAIVNIDMYTDSGRNPESGAVLCSDAGPDYWIFSTLTGAGLGTHPVNGNREFGYTLEGEGAIVYTMAVDRVTPNPFHSFAFMSDMIFAGGHRTWLGLQSRLAQYVNINGGVARALSPSSQRLDWLTVGRPAFGPQVPLVGKAVAPPRVR